MNLTLEIVSPNGQTLGAARRKVFGLEGGRIGRAPDCEWVIPNPYVSRHHATIRWISGTFYIESTGENGVAVSTPQAMLPRLERRALQNGDRLFIDEYEITVALLGATAEGVQPALGSASAAFAPTDDPFADIAPGSGVLAGSPGRPPSGSGLVDSLEPTLEELDPLSKLSGRAPASVITSPRSEQHSDQPSWNHTPGISDHYSPPPVPAIPDDWDKPSFGRKPGEPGGGAPAASGPAPSAGGPRTAAGVIPDDWDRTSFGGGKTPKPPGPSPSAPPAQSVPPARAAAPATPANNLPPQQRAVPMQPAPRTPPQVPPKVAADAAGGAAVSPARPMPGRPPAEATPIAPRPAGFDVGAFLRAAGVDPATVAPETAGALGLILRAVVQGVIEVLQARAEVKNQFRLPLTRVKTTENNPLKFAVNAEDALNSLLGRRNPAYLPPIEAFEDAFNDIRFHQVAMLAGMRAGFEHTMRRFDPDQLQEMCDKQVKRGGLLSMTSKSRYWELYTEVFQELSADRDEAFRRLFGEEFATAYEKQLEALKRNRNNPRR